METRSLSTEPLLAAPRRHDREKRGGDRATHRFPRRVLPGGRDPASRPISLAAIDLSHLPSPSPQPMSRPLCGGGTALLAPPPGLLDGAAAGSLTRGARALVLTGRRSFI